jgi:hypothetical protein
MNERHIKWYTPWLSREFEMLVFGDKRGLPLVLFPTSGARYYENKDFGLVGAIASYIDNGKVTGVTTTTFTSTARTNISRTCLTRGNTTIWPSSSALGMGRYARRILSLIRSFELQGYQALAR